MDDIIQHKVCSRCSKRKPISAFNRRGDGYRSECKLCQSLERINYRRRPRFDNTEIKIINSSRVYDVGNSQFMVFNLDVHNSRDIRSAINENERQIRDILQTIISVRKFKVSIFAKYEMKGSKGRVVEMSNESDSRTVEKFEEIKNALTDIYNDLINKIENDNYEESGFSFSKLLSLKIKICKYRAYRGGCKKYIRKLKSRNYLYIPNSNCDDCFFMCARRFVEKRKMRKILDFSGVHRPTLITDILLFELNNDIRVNIFTISSKSTKELIDIENEESDTEINPDLVEDDYIYSNIYPKFARAGDIEEDMNLLLYKEHFCLITNIKSFFKTKMYKCYNCFEEFVSAKALNSHIFKCRDHKENCNFIKETIKFKNYSKLTKAPFIIYCNIESTLSKEKCTPVVFGLFTHCSFEEKHDKIYSYDSYLIDRFINVLISEANRIDDILKNIMPMKLSEDQEREYNSAQYCYLCKTNFTIKDPKVRDHDHITGEYRGAAHKSCNLSFLRQKRYVPILFTNNTKYDANYIIRGLMNTTKIHLLAKTSEKFFTFNCKLTKSDLTFRFIDNTMFLGDNYEKICSTIILKKAKYRKLYYPYNLLRNYFQILEYYTPNRNDFYNPKTCKEMTDIEFSDFKQIFEKHKFKTLQEYLIMYSTNTVQLLCDAFESFRDVCISTYKLDPANYITLPGYAWDACLLMTEAQFEPIKDKEILKLLEDGIRGGICTCSEVKYAKETEEKKIVYMDANNLYGYCMEKPIPCGGFRLYTVDGDPMEILVNLKSDKNYILRVDLDYPDSLHAKHNELPLAPEHLHNKLIPNLQNKRDYVVYLPILLFYIEKGLKLRKISQILEFDEKPILKKWVDYNTLRRRAAKYDHEDRFYKLVINSVYGKTLENIRKRVYLKAINSNEDGIKYCSKPNYKRFIRIDNDCHIVELYQNNLIFDKPIYIGFVILELAKLHMYKFHYDCIKPNFEAKLMYTDTDSFVYYMTAKNFDKIKEHLDTDNNKIPGLFKFVEPVGSIKSFVCLKSKYYSYTTDKEEVRKGIPKHLSTEVISHQDYVDALLSQTTKNIMYQRFCSKNMELYFSECKKMCLSIVDEKRVPTSQIHTSALGHFKLKNDNYEHDLYLIK